MGGTTSSWEWSPPAPPTSPVQGSPMRLARVSSSPSVKTNVWKEKCGLERAAESPTAGPPTDPPGAGEGLSLLAIQQLQHSLAHAPPLWASVFPSAKGTQGWGFCRPHPSSRQLGPRSPSSCAGTSQVGRPAHPPTRLPARQVTGSRPAQCTWPGTHPY